MVTDGDTTIAVSLVIRDGAEAAKDVAVIAWVVRACWVSLEPIIT